MENLLFLGVPILKQIRVSQVSYLLSASKRNTSFDRIFTLCYKLFIDTSFESHVFNFQQLFLITTVNLLCNNICYNSKILYNVNLVCTKISRLCKFSLTFPFNSSEKHTFCVFVRIASET